MKKSQAPYRPNDPDTSTTHPSDADPFLLLTTPGGTPDAWISNQNTALGAALLPDLTAIGPRTAGRAANLTRSSKTLHKATGAIRQQTEPDRGKLRLQSDIRP